MTTHTGHANCRCTMPIIETTEALRRQATRLLAEAERLDSRPGEPTGEAVMVYFIKTHGHTIRAQYPGDVPRPRQYQYAAVRTFGGAWYLTGSRAYGLRDPMQWGALLDFIEKDEKTPPQIWLCTQMELLNPTDDESADTGDDACAPEWTLG